MQRCKDVNILSINIRIDVNIEFHVSTWTPIAITIGRGIALPPLVLGSRGYSDPSIGILVVFRSQYWDFVGIPVEKFSVEQYIWTWFSESKWIPAWKSCPWGYSVVGIPISVVFRSKYWDFGGIPVPVLGFHWYSALSIPQRLVFHSRYSVLDGIPKPVFRSQWYSVPSIPFLVVFRSKYWDFAGILGLVFRNSWYSAPSIGIS